jgi:flagellar motor switch protein FliG
MSTTAQAAFGGARKAAILLSVLNESEAVPILRSLPPSDLERVAEELANLPKIPAELTLQVLEEYKQMMAEKKFATAGGREVAVRLLVKTLGEAGAESMVQRLNRAKDNESLNLDSLQKSEPQQVAKFLAGEHAQTKALLLGHLEPRQASALLMQLNPEDRVDCVKRMAMMGQFSSEAAAKASQVINRRFGSGGKQTKRADTGFKNLADLMNQLGSPAAKEILESIESTEPALAISIRDLMFTFENFLEVPEPDLRELVNSIDKKTLAIALKSASEDLRTHIFRTMSSRAVELLKEDSEMMGPVRSKDVAKAQSEMIAIARKLESEGRMALRSQGEDEYVL